MGMGLLDGKVAVITGAGSGMAKASTMVFVREGAKVVAADISGAEKDTAAEVGDGVVPFHCDVTQESRRRGDDRAPRSSEFGRLDVVCNVAGIGTGAMIADVTMERLRPHDGRRPARRAARDEARDPGDARDRDGGVDRQLVVDRRARTRRPATGVVLGGQGRRHRAHEGRRRWSTGARASG